MSIEIKYMYKQYNEFGYKETESIQQVRTKDYAKYINKAKAYNQDCENELYISEVRDLSQTPKHTTCLGYTSGPVELNEFRLKGRDLKHSSLGGNAFQCIYLIPTLEF